MEEKQKMVYAECIHHPVKFKEIDENISKMKFDSDQEKSAFRQGWIAAIMSQSHFVFHETNPLDKLKHTS